MIGNPHGLSRNGLVLAGMLLAAAILPAGTNTWTGSQLRLGKEATLVASHPQDPDVVYAVFQPDLYRSADGGRSWTHVASFSHIFSLLVHPASPGTVYVGAAAPDDVNSRVYKSSDEGRTWSHKTIVGAAESLAGDPRDASVVFAGTSSGRIYKSTDAGESWPTWTYVAGAVASLVIDPNESNTLYAGTEAEASYYYYAPYTIGTFIGSTNGGSTWSNLRTQDLETIAAIAIDPSNSRRIYLGLESGSGGQMRGLFRSDNGGVSISLVRGFPAPANVSSIVIDPANPSTIYVGTDDGIYRTRDAGASWFSFGQVLASASIESLALSSDSRRLHVGTLYGAYDLEIATGPIDLAAGEAGSSRILSWSGDRLSLHTLSGEGAWSATPAEEPSSTWTAIAIATAEDGTSRVRWQHGDGRFAVEIVGAEGRRSASVVPTVGGYIPSDISVGSDGRTRLLWTSLYGQMSIGSIDAGTASYGVSYGPTPGWSAVAIADDSDGRTWALWRSVDGRAAVSVHRDGSMVRTYRWDAVANFHAEDIAIGSDGRARILATNVAGEMQIWTVDSDGGRSIGSNHESAGLRARRIAGGADGLTRVLWSDGSDHGSIWLLDSGGSLVSMHGFPAPADPIEGGWTGTFDSVDFVDCEASVEASATFTLEGTTLDGVLSAEERGCGARFVAFHGTLEGNRFQGTLMGGSGRYHFTAGSTATGILTGTTLEVTLTQKSEFPFPIPGGQMHLHK